MELTLGARRPLPNTVFSGRWAVRHKNSEPLHPDNMASHSPTNELDKNDALASKVGFRRRFKKLLSPFRTPKGSARNSASEVPSRSVTPALSIQDEGLPNDIPPTVPQSISPNLLLVSPITNRRSETPVLENSRGTWAGLRSALNVLGSSSTPIQYAVRDLLGVLDIYEAAARERDDYDQITIELENIAETLIQCVGEFSLKECGRGFSRIADTISKQVEAVKQKRMNLSRYSKTKDEDIIQSYRKVEQAFRQLQTWRNTNHQHIRALLRELLPVDDAMYDSGYSTTVKRRHCTEGTRVEVLSRLFNWANDPEINRMYWINGMAGTGKTALAYSLCKLLDEHHQLGASFFCSRYNSSCWNSHRIIPTLAYQLANYSAPFRSELCQVLMNEPDIGMRGASTQFERLIRTPLLNSKDMIPDNVAVVIDALDECEDIEGVKVLLELFYRHMHSLPLKLFLASRPEPVIRKALPIASEYVTILCLHELDLRIVESDIELYLHTALGSLNLAQQAIVELTQRAGSLFLYAEAIAQYIIPDGRMVDSRARLEDILSPTPPPFGRLDNIYSDVLKSAFDTSTLQSHELSKMKLVLWTCVCSMEPLPIATLAVLTGLTNNQVFSALDPLQSVLHVDGTSGLVSVIHASFPNHIIGRQQVGEFCCASEAETLAIYCFELMAGELKFNICNLQTSFIYDDQVEDLDTRIHDTISPALAYASRYWSKHLQHSRASIRLVKLLDEFLRNRFLFWMEVLNLKQCIGFGSHMLFEAQKWVIDSVAEENDQLRQWLVDARDFLLRFSSNPCSQSTPHIYVSALPFCSRVSCVYKEYWGKTCGLISPWDTTVTQNHSALVSRIRLTGAIGVVAWAMQPLSGFVIALVVGGRLLLSDALTSRVIWNCEYSSSIKCIGQSPNGRRFAVGSEDGLISVWSGESLFLSHASPMTFGPYGKSVESLGFSHDAKRIVSGSADCTIRILNAETGELILGPLRGHTGWVTAIQFSPEGRTLASASDDGTIRIWDAQHGNIVGVIMGHTSSVTSLAFSPNGTRIISGSNDCTIRVWDVSSRQIAIGPIKGHTQGVTSVTYSLDGSKMISSSYDSSVCVWDARSGRMVLGPLRGHTDSVTALAFSADGAYLASAGRDGTICLWNIGYASTRASLGEGHTEDVTSVAFSLDGNKIASGSQDDTLIIWDSHTGRALGNPIHTHSDGVGKMVEFTSGISQQEKKGLARWRGTRVL
ncbi:unnamed protein product [Rhizoctonia solani]|uniref:NACHT domain-containing protein n=1 Tax=Rhizoctonia solani TaxID=456999 RepID=A0A8H3I6V7_9AGAM|nr:unnamed protein product [Rhizoctonia solani]